MILKNKTTLWQPSI